MLVVWITKPLILKVGKGAGMMCESNNEPGPSGNNAEWAAVDAASDVGPTIGTL